MRETKRERGTDPMRPMDVWRRDTEAEERIEIGGGGG